MIIIAFYIITDHNEGKFIRVKRFRINIKYEVLASVIALVSADTYVIGGNIVTPNSEPHILSLQKRSSHFCGATMISATHGVCASHCYYSANTVTAVAGAHNIKKPETTQQKRVLAEFKKHPNYNSNNISNDVATLKFSVKFDVP